MGRRPSGMPGRVSSFPVTWSASPALCPARPALETRPSSRHCTLWRWSVRSKSQHFRVDLVFWFFLCGWRYRGKWVNIVSFSCRTMGCRLSALPFSAGYKIYDLTLTPTQSRLAAGEQLVLSCMATTELNVGIEFNWTHSGNALVSAEVVKWFFVVVVVSLERHI